jgi:hypothetical protein
MMVRQHPTRKNVRDICVGGLVAMPAWADPGTPDEIKEEKRGMTAGRTRPDGTGDGLFRR